MPDELRVYFQSSLELDVVLENAFKEEERKVTSKTCCWVNM